MKPTLLALWASLLALAMVTGCVSVATPAAAGPTPSEISVTARADGLSDPGRDKRTSAKEPLRSEQTVTVKQGNTLWSIAAATLKTNRADRIAGYWPLIYRANRPVIGSDPDLIMPGQVLALPHSDGRPDARSNPSPSGDRASRRGEEDQHETGSKVGLRQSTGEQESQHSAAYAPSQTFADRGITGTASQREGSGVSHGPKARRSDVEPARYAVEFVVRDALFGFRVGAGIKLRYPNGDLTRFQLGSSGQLTVRGLAEGRYVVHPDVAGISSPFSFRLSRGRTIQLSVVSYWDLVAVLLGTGILLSVLVLGRRLFRRPPRFFPLSRMWERSIGKRTAFEIGVRRLVAIWRFRLASNRKWLVSRANRQLVRVHLKDGRLMEGWQDPGRRSGNEDYVLLGVVRNYDDQGRAVGRPVDLLLRPSSVEVLHRDQISLLEHVHTPSCVVSIGQRAGSWTVACAGRLDIQAANKLAAAVDSCLLTSRPLLHVDCSRVEAADESGMVVLSQVVAKCKRAGVPLKGSPATERAASQKVDVHMEDRSEASSIIFARPVLLSGPARNSLRRNEAQGESRLRRPGSQDRSSGAHTPGANEDPTSPRRGGRFVAGRGDASATQSDGAVGPDFEGQVPPSGPDDHFEDGGALTPKAKGGLD